MTTPAYLLKSQQESAARLAAKGNLPPEDMIAKDRANVGARRRDGWPPDDEFADVGQS